MLFLGNSSKKTFILFVLVLLIGGVIFWQWFKLAPLSAPTEEESTWEQITKQVDTAKQKIEAQLEVNRLEGQQTWEEFQRQQKEKELINDIKEYWENSTSTSATSTEDEIIDNR
ncbi:hypothetical protein C4566_02340 [Candidatus Parcubacteria bacterium]|nr:MAG: hypothetical protein C4566_02340 [Candidatus Parcubacteria bacterium]